ncbi:MAG: homoserine dehydrogenase [Nitrospinota bacterium]|nr:MAG: homoserine dehydrogenase [Nitrospinota bacterium]
MNQRVTVGLIGLGTVGSSVVQVLTQQRTLLQERCGIDFQVKRIAVRDRHKPRSIRVDPQLLTTEVQEVLTDPEIDLVVELMGGTEPARSYLLKAIEGGKHIVTANKALLAEHGEEIFTAAARHQVDIGCEASVGGGIPIIRAIKEGFVANRFLSIFGIVNGTCNYILSRMTAEGGDFATVLQEAMDKGYAEPDPTLDIEGIDSAHKIAILASLAFGVQIPFHRVYTEGISRIDQADIRYAQEFGYKIKLLAIAKEIEGQVEVRVHPTMVPSTHLLYSVEGVYNAITVVGDQVGENSFIGKGAGGPATASAVIGDIVEIGRNITQGSVLRVPHRSYLPQHVRASAMRNIEDIVSEYYLRFSALDKPGVLSKISGILGANDISIASVIQKGRREGGAVPVVMMTHHAQERNVRRALQAIDQLDVITAPTVLIRVENFTR